MSLTSGLTKALVLALGIGVCGGLLAYGVTEEVAVGGLSGKVVMKENGRPLPNAVVTLEPVYKGEDIDTPIRIHRAETDQDGSFRINGIVSADYLLTITGDAHSMSRKPVKVTEGKRSEGDFRLEPIDPYLDLYASQHVYTPQESPKFQVKGFFRKDVDVTFTAFKLDMKKVLSAGNLSAALSPLAREDYKTHKLTDPRTLGAVVDTWTKTPKRDLEGVFVESIDGKNLKEGLYWIQAKGAGLVTGSWFMVTTISLVSKNFGNDAVAFVTDITTGKPVAGAAIATFSPEKSEAIGVTGSDGSLRYKLPGKTVVATMGQSQAFVDLYVRDDGPVPLRMLTYTDRPIYRPGDTVEFKGIVRKLVGRDYVVPASGPVEVEMKDADENSLGKLKLTTNSMGTYSGSFQLNKEMGPGYYTITSTFDGQDSQSGVSVAAYRKPTYSITVTPEKPYYVKGDKARMKVKTEYYFGGPVPHAKVSAYVYRSEFFDPSVFGEDYAEAWGGEGEGSGGEYVADVPEVVTDENGEAWIEFDTKGEKDETAETDYIYNVDVSVADEGGKYYDGSGSVKVLRGDFILSAETPDAVVTPGTQFTVTLRAGSPDGKPVGNVSVDLESGVQFWNGTDMEFFKPEKQTVQLDASGTAKVQLTATRAGSYVIEAKARDSRGNTIGDSNYVWASGDVDQNAFEPTDLEITLDKMQYKPGDTAKVVIKCGKPGGSALLTLEGDKLYEYRVVPLDKPAVTVDIPVTAELAPNAFVDVAYVREKGYNSTEEGLRVDDPIRGLKIDVKADKDVYKPGEMATYQVTTTNSNGQPTPAEVSLAVVDESIYAIAEDHLDLLKEFYPRRYNRVETQYSFPDLYLDGDKAPTSIQVRRKFKDTAFWAAAVATDASGHASVTVPLPDNLTTWRATAYGITSRTEVGKGVSKVLARRDLMVRLEAPAFMVGEDKQRIAALITNDTGADASVNLELTAQGVALDGQLRQEIQVSKGDTKSVDFTMSTQNAGEAVVTAKVWTSGGATDGVEAKVPVLPHGRTVRERYAGAVDAAGSITVTKRSGADPNVGGLKVSVAPTIAPALVQSLDVLIDFPYGCVEQTMSRFLPVVTVTQAMQAGGFPRPARAAEMPAMVAEGLTRLYRMQHSSGAWGWWEYDADNTFMTAYVIDGLRRARQAGISVDQGKMDRAIEWAKKEIAKPLPAPQPVTSKWEKEYQESERRRLLNDQAFLAYLIASSGDKATAHKWFAAHPLKSTPLVAAYGALTAQANGEDVTPALAALAAQATVSGAVASWPEDYWGVETTARCFDALIRVKADHPLVDKVARGMMEKRRGRIWWSTRDTSFALMGLSRYVVMTHELAQTGQIQIKLNGAVVGTVNGGAADSKLDIPIANLTAGENRLEFVGVGIKRIYYSAELHQVDVAGDIAAAPAEGLTVERKYFKLSTRRFEDGSVKFAPGKEPVTSADPGDLIQVQITLKSDRPREYILIEDPIPAACRVTEREDVSSADDWTWWWDKIQIFDDHVALFAQFIPTGEKVITYTIRVENPGLSSALPTAVSSMYDPDAVASSSGSKLEVSSK